MFLVYLIPNDALEPQFSKSLKQIADEDTYANFLFNSDASIMDNFMDDLMVRTCYVSENYESTLQAAFDNNGYPRYWNGYVLFLRPFLTQFSYQQIRYISMLALMAAFCFCFSGIHRKYGSTMAFGFAISILMCFLILIGESLQYFSVFILLFLEILFLLYHPFFSDDENVSLLFFAAGMATNFFDLLTSPLLTLGIPLILAVSGVMRKNKKDFIFETIKDILVLTVSWGAGYALCWAAKWLIGTLVLGDNIFRDALTTAKFRVEGNDAYPLDRVLMFRLNFETYYFAKGRKPFIFVILSIILLCFRLIRSHGSAWQMKFILTMIIGSYPYIWFSVFANHSQLHYFYTYRIQAVTMFAVFAAFSNSIDSGMPLQSDKTE